MDIGIIIYLLEHEVGDIGSRNVGIRADEERITGCVCAGSGCVGEP